MPALGPDPGPWLWTVVVYCLAASMLSTTDNPPPGQLRTKIEIEAEAFLAIWSQCLFIPGYVICLYFCLFMRQSFQKSHECLLIRVSSQKYHELKRVITMITSGYEGKHVIL